MTKTYFKPLPIILDRLAHALKAQGIKVKRSQLLEISAGAFGHRNSNELTAAAKAGDINPHPARVIGRVNLPDGQSVIIVNDQLGNMPYAIDETFLEQVAAEERREEIGITPYGHLAALYEVLDAVDIPEIVGGATTSEVHVGRISHKHGENIYVAADDDGLTMQVAEYVRENWDDEVSDHAAEDQIPEAMTDAEVVEAYFELCQNHNVEEYLDTSVEEIKARVLPKTEEMPVTPRRYALQHEMDNEPIFIVDTYRKDKEGDYVTVAEVPRTNEPEADITLAQHILNGLNGDSVPLLPAGHVLTSDLLSIADTLVDGSQADIWFDAHEYMDEDNPEDPDTVAYNRICDTQGAMSNAAAILRQIASQATTDRQVSIHTERNALPDGPTDNILERQKNEPVWITDSEGQDTMQVTGSHMAALGLDFHKDEDETLPLTENEYEVLLGREVLNKNSEYRVECGFSVLYKDLKWIAPEIGFTFDEARDDEREKALEKARAYMTEKKDAIERLGGHIFLFEDATDDEHELTILLPFDLARESDLLPDWEAALSYLLLPASEQEKEKRVACQFVPQVWVNDNAVTVDPSGNPEWDGTFDALRWGSQWAEKMLSEHVYDEYATEGTMTPEWVRNWTRVNPFEVDVQGLEKLFEGLLEN